MGSTEGNSGLNVVPAGPGLKQSYQVVTTADRPAATKAVSPGRSAADLFTRYAIEFAAQRPGRTITLLQAGCATAGSELDLAALREVAHDLEVSYIDDAVPAARAAVDRRPDLSGAIIGELRQVPLRPRTFDLVQCALLLHRVGNAEMVLGRLAESVRPGGLLMLRLPDPDSAAGFLDRHLPGPLRALAWRSARPGQPGPYPAKYEPVASARGIEMFVSRHGLVFANRATTAADATAAPARVAGQLVGRLSGGRISPDHDELCYVIRKPEDRFARVLQ